MIRRSMPTRTNVYFNKLLYGLGSVQESTVLDRPTHKS